MDMNHIRTFPKNLTICFRSNALRMYGRFFITRTLTKKLGLMLLVAPITVDSLLFRPTKKQKTSLDKKSRLHQEQNQNEYGTGNILEKNAFLSFLLEAGIPAR